MPKKTRRRSRIKKRRRRIAAGAPGGGRRRRRRTRRRKRRGGESVRAPAHTQVFANNVRAGPVSRFNSEGAVEEFPASKATKPIKRDMITPERKEEMTKHIARLKPKELWNPRTWINYFRGGRRRKRRTKRRKRRKNRGGVRDASRMTTNKDAFRRSKKARRVLMKARPDPFSTASLFNALPKTAEMRQYRFSPPKLVGARPGTAKFLAAAAAAAGVMRPVAQGPGAPRRKDGVKMKYGWPGTR